MSLFKKSIGFTLAALFTHKVQAAEFRLVGIILDPQYPIAVIKEQGLDESLVLTIGSVFGENKSYRIAAIKEKEVKIASKEGVFTLKRIASTPELPTDTNENEEWAEPNKITELEEFEEVLKAQVDSEQHVMTFEELQQFIDEHLEE